MTIYFVDSSALVKRYINEIGSAWVLSLCDPALNNDILIAAITSVEIVASITRKSAAEVSMRQMLQQRAISSGVTYNLSIRL
ncbi:hypothetical protein [Microcoleus sp. AT3-D2]|uniref:hypothetical protein n=1 Tax=Microcoleus sp. AT3-D2 TaxID=2818612 RepID=UPI002FD56AA0